MNVGKITPFPQHFIIHKIRQCCKDNTKDILLDLPQIGKDMCGRNMLMVLVTLVYGFYRFGRRKLILPCSIVSLVLGIIMIFIPGYPYLIALRFFVAIVVTARTDCAYVVGELYFNGKYYCVECQTPIFQ